MKKLQVMIDDELMEELKIVAVKRGTSLKDVVTEAIINHLGPIESVPKPTIIKSNDTSIKKSLNHSLIESLKEESIKVSNDTKIKVSKDEPEQSGDMWDLINAPNDPMDERYFYILRKTHQMGLDEDEDTWATNSTLRWLIPKGCSKHFDRDGNLIPFRYSDQNLRTVEPTQEQIAEIERKYGKPVTVEV